MSLVASSPSSAFHMAKPECSRKKRRRRRRSKAMEDRKAEFVTRWRPETTFGYRSFEPGEKRLQVDVVSLELEQQRRGESPKNPDERLKSSRQRRQLYQHSSSPQTLRWVEELRRGREYKLGNCCWVSTDDLSRLTDMQYKKRSVQKNKLIIPNSSPPRPWTPRPASVSFLLVEEQQQKQQVQAKWKDILRRNYLQGDDPGVKTDLRGGDWGDGGGEGDAAAPQKNLTPLLYFFKLLFWHGSGLLFFQCHSYIANLQFCGKNTAFIEELLLLPRVRQLFRLKHKP